MGSILRIFLRPAVSQTPTSPLSAVNIMNKSFMTGLILLMMSLQPALAQDKDDDLKPDETKHLEASDEASTDVEQKNPKVAAELRQFIADHVKHANTKDIDAYMNDFDLSQQKHPELLREYSERAMALPNLKIEVLAIEFAKIQKEAATIHTRQRSSYTNEHGVSVIDDVILSYRLVRDAQHSWKILFTERRRLSAQ